MSSKTDLEKAAREGVYTTYKFRIKDSTHLNYLAKKAAAVNYVWNYCNEISQESAYRQKGNKLIPWIGEFELIKLTTGISKQLGLSSTTIRQVCIEFVARRNARKQPKLRWRSHKRNLGWIPFKTIGVQVASDSFKYQKRKFKFWKSREIVGEIKTGCFSQDAQGHWYICFSCSIAPSEKTLATQPVGVDLGLKSLATVSDGTIIDNPKHLQRYASKLATAQRARKKKQVVKIHAKIANSRKDHLHKESTKLVKKYKQIFVGDVSSLKLKKTRMAKAVSDSGWGMFKSMLEYKAKRLGVDFKVTDEKHSTVTCSDCMSRTGPGGLSNLGVRNWKCSNCGSQHIRDVNAAKNILNFALGHKSPLGESQLWEGAKTSKGVIFI